MNIPFLENYSLTEIVLAAVLIVSLFIQLYYYLIRYPRIPVYRQKVKNRIPPVSVLVIVDDNMLYLEEIVPKLMSQDYPSFEVVVVDAGTSVEIVDKLTELSVRHNNFRFTRLNPDPKFKYRRKLALTVGIKACSYPNVIFTEPDSYPSSGKWLSLMAKGFTSGDVVIGYCGIEPSKGLANRFIRCDRLMMSVRYLSSAISGKPYRGIAQNIGYTSKIYFDNRGYNHLNLSIGDDDLFIQKIASRENTSIIINPNATVRQYHYGGLASWNSGRKFFSYTYRHYPMGVRFTTTMEFVSRYLFLGTAAALIALMPYIFWIAAAALVLLRYFFVLKTMSRICRRLGEKGLLWMFIYYDLVSPVYEAGLSVSRRIKPSDGIWNF